MLRLYVHYCLQASGREKCPGCGIRAEHKMRMSEELGKLVHVCGRCSAIWARPPVVKFESWQTKFFFEESEEEGKANPDGTRTTTVMHAQREPVIVKDPRLATKKTAMRMGS